MQKVLHEIIKVDLVGYLKGRNIGEAIRLIDDIFFYSWIFVGDRLWKTFPLFRILFIFLTKSVNILWIWIVILLMGKDSL